LTGKIAVGNVILNRVKSAEFPDCIYDVIFDDNWGIQFEPVENGSIYNTPTEESILAAKLCLDGASVVDASLYFLNPAKASNFWAIQNCIYISTIGNHQFYE
jgi:N-acetylmuramoyl-L-alanine amidase